MSSTLDLVPVPSSLNVCAVSVITRGLWFGFSMYQQLIFQRQLRNTEQKPSQQEVNPQFVYAYSITSGINYLNLNLTVIVHIFLS